MHTVCLYMVRESDTDWMRVVLECLLGVLLTQFLVSRLLLGWGRFTTRWCLQNFRPFLIITNLLN